MFQHVSFSGFCNSFRYAGRETHFSYDGLGILFEYLEEVEDAGDPIELDVIGLCCDFFETDRDKYQVSYGMIDGVEDDDDFERYLSDKCYFVGRSGGTFVMINH